jgi:hypothetical protein
MSRNRERIEKDAMKRLMIFAGLVAVAATGASLYELQRSEPASAQAYVAERPPHPLDGQQGRDGSIEELEAARQPCVATLDRFRKIRQGSPRYYVKNVMRCEGELVASERIGYGNFETYRFVGREPGSFMLVQIRDQTVSSTVQMGLK